MVSARKIAFKVFLFVLAKYGVHGTPQLGLVSLDIARAVGELPVVSLLLPPKPPAAVQPDPGSRAIAGFAEEKKGGGISGFLGLDNVLNPVIQLKRVVEGETKKEPDCIRTHFMGPYVKGITISANGSIGARADRTCRWNFIGTEPCIPMLNCEEFKLLEKSDKCKDCLEVYDGNLGYEKFCGMQGPINITARGDLRDLYVKYTAYKSQSEDDLKFKCTVTCSNRYTGNPLKDAFQPIRTSLCQCGKRPNHDRIVNGENATKHEFPWLAALVKAKTRQPFCGASAINDRTLVTAAHCFKGDYLQVSNVEILMGGHLLDVTPNFAALNGARPLPQTYDPETLKSLDSANGSVRFEIDEVVIHPLYVTQTNDFDVAVIKLTTSIDFSAFPQLSPICLPKLGSYLRTYAQRTAFVSGWGLPGAEALGTSALLQKLNVTIFTPKNCKDTYAHRVNRRMLCAGYAQGGKDSCMGDSGGPLVLEDSPQLWHIVGTVSWGEGCAQSDSPGAYIRMTEVSQWIHYHSNMNSAVWCQVPVAKPSKS